MDDDYGPAAASEPIGETWAPAPPPPPAADLTPLHGCALFGFAIVLMLVLGVVGLVIGQGSRPVQEYFNELTSTALVLSLFLPQLGLGAATGLGVLLAARPATEVLALRPVRWWVVPATLVGTFAIGLGGDWLYLQLKDVLPTFGMEDSVALLGRMLADLHGPAKVLTLLGLGFLPAVFEEGMFRGLLHRAFRPWGATATVLLTAVLFALMHVSPIHVIVVLPLGLYFGVVRHLTGSLYPVIAAHLANNLVAGFVSQGGAEPAVDLPATYVLAGLFAGLAILPLLARGRRANPGAW